MEIITSKKCNGCDQMLPISAFKKRSGACGVRSRCKNCNKDADRTRYRAKHNAKPRIFGEGYDYRVENAAFRNWPALGQVVGILSPSVGLVMGRAA